MRITREIQIDMGHRVTNHGGKCKNLHGHRYRIEACVTGSLRNHGEQEGMIMDFGFIKRLMMDHIDTPCDHGTCLWIKDPELVHELGPMYEKHVKWVEEFGLAESTWRWGKLYLLPMVPTAENLAEHWFQRLMLEVADEMDGLGYLYSIRVWETPACNATYKATQRDMNVLEHWRNQSVKTLGATPLGNILARNLAK